MIPDRGGMPFQAFLFFLLAVIVLGFGCAMIRMPGKSFRGPLPPLTAEQTALRDELRGHVQMLAGEIGERNVYLPKKSLKAWDIIRQPNAARNIHFRLGCFIPRAAILSRL